MITSEPCRHLYRYLAAYLLDGGGEVEVAVKQAEEGAVVRRGIESGDPPQALIEQVIPRPQGVAELHVKLTPNMFC